MLAFTPECHPYVSTRSIPVETELIHFCCQALHNCSSLILPATKIDAYADCAQIVYSVCGFSFWKFCIALVLSLPKQVSRPPGQNAPPRTDCHFHSLSTFMVCTLEPCSSPESFADPVLLPAVGVVLAGESSTTKSSHLVSDIVWGVTAVVSVGAGWYIWYRMSKVRVDVWREIRYVGHLTENLFFSDATAYIGTRRHSTAYLTAKCFRKWTRAGTFLPQGMNTHHTFGLDSTASMMRLTSRRRHRSLSMARDSFVFPEPVDITHTAQQLTAVSDVSSYRIRFPKGRPGC